MRFIPTRIHGMLDYLMGIVLIAAPWLFGFDRGGAETWVPVILGAGVILYSLFTDYELGAVRKLSMRTHLMMDLIGGIILAASPWLFNFDEFVYLPHLILGLLEIGAAIFTKRVPETERTEARPTSSQTAAESSRTGNARIVTPPSRGPMGSKAEPETRTETESDRERARREGKDLE